MVNINYEKVLDYILCNELDDFTEYLSYTENLTEHERETLQNWLEDNISTTNEVKRIFKKLSKVKGNHIYVSAICEQYKIGD